MKVLVVGQGGREHAIIKSLKRSPKVDTIYCAPGNGGIEAEAICLPIKEDDFQGLVDAVKQNNIDLTIVGPEKPLFEGIVDYFRENNLAIIGPTGRAAQIEGSKAFAKDLMKKYNIPTADYQVFYSSEAAIDYVKAKGAPIVIKANGLAAGKGVTVAQNINEAIDAIESMMEDKVFGDAGNKIVVEEFLKGEELTVMAFVDGTTVLPMEPAQDHKPIFDGDKGPNTGGMGSYSPVPHINNSTLEEINEEILVKVADALVKEGIYYSGILYAGLILTDQGPKVIEFNARFGDPETQVVLPRLKTDLVDIFAALTERKLSQITTLEWDTRAAVCVIMASEGYPGEYPTGLPIQIEELPVDAQLFIAGAKKEEGMLVTSGGRVLGVTGLAEDIESAKKVAYNGISRISFQDAHYRTDIADKAINFLIDFFKQK